MHTVGIHHLLYAELKKAFLIWKRYPLQPIIGLCVMMVMLLGISLGVTKFPLLELFEGGEKRVMVASFFSFVIAMGAMGEIGSKLEEDIKLGLVEPVFLSRHSAAMVIFARSLAGSLSGLLSSFFTLWIMAWYSGANLHMGISVLCTLLILNIALSGIGLLVAGLVIFFKRAASVIPIFYLAFGAFIAKQISLKTDDSAFYYPIKSAVELFSRVLFGTGVSLSEVCLALFWATANAALGMAFLRWCVSQSRRSGTLAHY